MGGLEGPPKPPERSVAPGNPGRASIVRQVPALARVREGGTLGSPR